MNKYQFVFAASKKDPNKVHEYFAEEAEALKRLGLSVSTSAGPEAERIVYRGVMMYEESQYPSDPRYVNSWKEYISTSRLSLYHHLIEDISIPTFFCKELNEETARKIKETGWERAFIKNDVKSLFAIDDYASAWPDNSFEFIAEKLSVWPYHGVYAIRKFIDPQVFLEEDRYWVINNKIYYREATVPDVVKEAAKRLSVLGSKYYVIDATPDFIVEVNPGESSDRYADNPPELFAEWLKDGFGA